MIKKIVPLFLLSLLISTSTAADEQDRQADTEAEIFSSDEAEESIDVSELPSSAYLDVPEILQNPELPTGCESVSLTIALVYKGYELEKTTIAEDYLVKSTTDDFVKGFVGDPFSSEGMGIFPPGLLYTARKYFRIQSSDEIASDISGSDFTDLLAYVAAGEPVITWSTMYLCEPDFSDYSITYMNEEYTWYYQEHCVVLCGYDLEKGTVTVSDPLEGIVERDLQTFSDIYEKTGKYAIII
ncbi:MAG: C39 family peptidase [Eubacteriales bacterium]|nr:C39 family peptidase [Eubacteriales bacterium]